MIDILKALKTNQTILGIIKSENYNNILERVPKLLGTKGSVCYITTNKTFESLNEFFRKKKVNTENIIFIDAISKSFKSAPDQSDSVYYISSPGALTELSLTISKFLRHDFDFIIFDTITNLMVYNKEDAVEKFLRSLIDKIKETKTKAVFFALDIKEQESLLKQGNMYFDKVVNCCK